MKRKFIFLLMFLATLAVQAQVQKFTAYELSSKTYNGYSWSDWSKFEPTEILVSVNLDDKKIKIYSQETQIYDIIEFNEKEVDADGDESYRLYCEDKDGQNCHVDLYFLKSQDSMMQIYIRYQNMQWVYNLIKQ